MKKLIYLDNAATTQVSEEVLNEMLPFFRQTYSNPSAVYSFAGEGKKAVDRARKQAAELIGANVEEIYFTGGGSESDNWALKAAAEAYCSKGKHIITSKIEHHAILHGSPDALALSLPAYTEKRIVPVGTEHQRKALSAQMCCRKFHGSFQMLIDGSLSAIIKTDRLIKEIIASLLAEDVMHREDGP